MQIALPIIAILMIVGSWSAWRRSPLYSVKITLKIVGVFLLIVAAVVGVSMAIFNGPWSHSFAAQAILAGVVIIAIATAATGLIIHITDAHVAQVPPSVQLVAIHRRKVQRWFWRTVVYELINAGAALVLPYAWNWLPLFLGGFVLLLCGPMLLGFYMRARRLDLGMSVVVAGPWAHWQFTTAQWESWAKNQLAWEQSKIQPMVWKRDWRKLLKAVLYMTLIFVLAALLSPGSAREKAAVTAGLLVFVALIGSCANWFNRNNCQRNYRRLLAAPPEAYFGDEGLFCNGEYSPWILSGSYLLEATATSDPPAHLVLIFQSFNGSASVSVAKRIPIPEGRWPDVELLQRKLQACCPKAFVHMLKPAA
jgi:hypothetical protein